LGPLEFTALVNVTEKLFAPGVVTGLVQTGVHWLRSRARFVLPNKQKLPPNPKVHFGIRQRPLSASPALSGPPVSKTPWFPERSRA